MAYKRTEIGWPIIGIIIVVVAFNLFVALVTEEPPSIVLVTEFVEAAIIIVLIPFFAMTVRVSKTTLDWWLCFGLFPQSVHLDSIVSIRIVALQLINGYGIRSSGANRLWRVSGSSALSLQLADESTIALGVSNPALLAESIRSAIGAPSTG
jgi:hypothetical protein